MDTAIKQDMPPPGGYQRINYARVPPKTYLTGIQMFAGYAIAAAIGIASYFINAREVKQEEIEMRSARNVVFTVLLAERDREYLKQLRRNRDEESKLMAKVKDWEVGTWYGEPIFKTLPKDKFVDPSCREFYAHADGNAYVDRATMKYWS